MPFIVNSTLMGKLQNILDYRATFTTDSTVIPLDFDNLVLWLRSDMGVVLSGSNVSDWLDQSGKGNNFTQSDSLKRSLYTATGGVNSLPGLDFVTNDTMTHVGNLSSATDYTVFSVFNQRNVNIDQQLFGATGNVNICENSQESSGDKLAYFDNGTGRLFFGAAQNGAQAITWLMSGVNISVYRNNVQSGTTQSRALQNSYATQQWIGSNQDLGGNVDMILSEMIVYDRALTTEERTAIHSYFSVRYGL